MLYEQFKQELKYWSMFFLVNTKHVSLKYMFNLTFNFLFKIN